MKIKYNGEKKLKRIEYGGRTFYFAPDCVVGDLETIKFLLSSDRRGLFAKVVEEKVAEVPKMDTTAKTSDLGAKMAPTHNIGDNLQSHNAMPSDYGRKVIIKPKKKGRPKKKKE